MRRMALVLLLAIGLAGTLQLVGATPGRIEQAKAEVLKVDAEVNQALQLNDTAALARIWADGLQFTTHTGQQLDKTQILDLFRSKTVVVDKLRHENVHVNVYGNTAV
ncbi:MAG: nuclear transport factor 2 family protein, partial [Terriglobia bacterium]